MRVPFFQSLAVRLAGLILILSGLTFLVLTEINRRAVERILVDQAEVQAMMATVAVADGLDGVIGSAERITRTLAREFEGRALTSTDAERMARNVLLDHPNLYGFSITVEPSAPAATGERLGVYVHRSNTVSRFTTRDLVAPEQAYWNRDWYREVIDKAQAIWSEPFFDQGGTDRNVVRIAVPFFRPKGDEREPAGVVTAVIELDWLRRLANSNEFSDTSYTIIFSRSGRIIIHPKPNYAIAETLDSLAEKEGAPELASIFQSVRSRRQGALAYVEQPLQRRVHVNYKPTKVAGWGVIVGYDEAEFLKNQRAFRWITAAFLGVALLVLGGIVIGVTRHALRPIGPLAAAADEIAQRNLECAIPEVVRTDEIGFLTRSFRAMRDALKAQHVERQWAKQAIEHQLKYNNLIIDSIGELIFVLTKVLSVSRINPAVTRVTGYRLSDLMRTPLDRLVRLEPAAAGATEPKSRLLLETLNAGKSLHDLPVTLTTKQGAELHGRLTFVPLQDGKQIVGAVATFRVDSPA